MKLFSTILSLLLLALPALAQNTPVTVPLGNVTVSVTPPPPSSFTQPVSQTVSQIVNQTVTINGIQYTVTGALSGTQTGTLTFTQVGAPVPIPVPSVSVTLTGVINAAGQTITSANGGAVVGIAGTNLGAAGAVTVAGLPAIIVSWTATAVTVVLPRPTLPIAGKVVLTPAGGAAVTSAFDFALTIGTAELPVARQPGIFVGNYIGSDGLPNPILVRAGEKLTLQGVNFGERTARCRVEINLLPATLLAWMDSVIQVQVPATASDPTHRAQLLVWRSPEQYDVGLAPFTLVAAP